MIEAINRDFVALDHSIDKLRFPKSLPSLAAVEHVYKNFTLSWLGFNMSTVVSADGETPLATAGSASLKGYKTATQWNAEKYVEFLGRGLENHKQLTQLAADSSLAPEELRKASASIGDAVNKEYLDSCDRVSIELTGKPVPKMKSQSPRP